jgi:hypothetical protein
MANPGYGNPRGWRPLGMVDPGDGDPWGWWTLGMADPNQEIYSKLNFHLHVHQLQTLVMVYNIAAKLMLDS